jgi:hypothetical protein
MARFTFTPESLRRGIARAKVITPESGDFCFRFSDGHLNIFSADKRRYCAAVVHPVSSEDAPDGWTSNPFYITKDKTSLFESSLGSVTVTVSDKLMKVDVTGTGDSADQTRSATLKMRNESSRRPPVPSPPPPPEGSKRVHRLGLERLLRLASCSALVKETKTDEEMRVNQVHFYPDPGVAASNARFFGTAAFMPDLSLDLSIVSADIPSFRGFCSKSLGEYVVLYQDKNRMYLSDDDSGSVLAVSRVACPKPPFESLSRDGFSVSILVPKRSLSDALDWASTAVDGTQRVTFSATVTDPETGSGTMRLVYNHQEVSTVPVRFESGSSLSADFPVGYFSSIVSYMDDDKPVRLRFGHSSNPAILEISSSAASPDNIHSINYLLKMREH